MVSERLRMWSALLLACIIVVPSPAMPKPLNEVVSADHVFAQMSRMVGTWKPADKPESPLRIHFYLTAGDTVLVESWLRGTQPHSLTLYHRDGAELIATHYCPQGNQPRLVLSGRDKLGLHFALRDATDLDTQTEAHQHDLWFDFTDPHHPVRSEVYYNENMAGPIERIQLVRAEKR